VRRGSQTVTANEWACAIAREKRADAPPAMNGEGKFPGAVGS
jgi:hypothetical protein